MKGWEFDAMFRTGLRVQGDLVRLLFIRGDINPARLNHVTNDTSPNVGYAVGKRQGKAHVRTRGRRILREAFRRLEPYIAPDVNMVFSLRPRGLDSKATQIFRDMAAILSRHGLLTVSKDDVLSREWNAPVRR